MDETYHSLLAEGVERKMHALELSIMEDIIRRIKKAGSITETADWQIQKLVILGSSTEDIRALIEKAVDGNQEMVKQLYDEVIAREYTDSKHLYEAVGKEFIPYEQNAELQQLVGAMVEQSSTELFNITRSAGFMLDNGNGGKVFTPITEVYNGYLDEAITGMVSGAYDYNTLARKLVNQMTSSGLRSSYEFKDTHTNYGVDFASGFHNRIDVAARRALLTGFGQVAGHVTDLNAQRLGTQYFEVAWHPGARPDHAEWQGKVYTKEELITKCGLGTGPGLLGWNCRHSYYPFIKGVSERQWSDEWLAEKNKEEAETTMWRGKEYNTYQATQKQRLMETAMRAQRERVQLLREAEADPETITTAQCRYQANLQAYRDFSDKMGLDTQMERVYTGRTAGRISPSPQAFAKWQMEQAEKKEKRQVEKEMRALIRQTGGKHYPPVSSDDPKDVQASAAYRKISQTYDIDKIAESSGMSPKEVAQVKRHVFYDKHETYNGYRLLDPDYDMAVAWERLKRGDPLERDIILLKHELLEDQLEKEYHLSIQEAHKRASAVYDWGSLLEEETGGKGEKDGLLQVKKPHKK